MVSAGEGVWVGCAAIATARRPLHALYCVLRDTKEEVADRARERREERREERAVLCCVRVAPCVGEPPRVFDYPCLCCVVSCACRSAET